MRKPQSRDWGFVVYGIPAVKYLESSTAKPVFKNATNVAFFRLSTPEALRGCRLTRSRGVEALESPKPTILLYGAQAVARVKQGFREANSLASSLFHALSSAKGRVEGDETLKVFCI
jgi:hypothetical protein